MTLTKEEQDILDGSLGPVMAKILKTVVMQGELFGAEKLADTGGNPHTSMYFGAPYMDSLITIFEEIADAGLKAHAPYTVNPMPMDLNSVEKDAKRAVMALKGFPLQSRLTQVHARLGGVGLNKWSCACYLPEVGNHPEPGTVVSWAESSAVNYGNSVLGLRINRMATGMELMCAVAGKVPVFGLLTDEGRKAKWHVDVQLSSEPHWGALGGAIGMKLVEDVPYITGIDEFLGGDVNDIAVGKLKAMGSATASSGAIGLYHVENITPEAVDQGRDLLIDDYQTYVIDDDEYKRVRDGFQNRWKDPNGAPTRVFIGCPHNTYQEMVYWGKNFVEALEEAGQEKLAIPVNMASSGVVRDHLLDEEPILYRDMRRAGIEFTNMCVLVFTGLKGYDDIERPVTNSNKARYYSNMRLYDDADLVQIGLTGEVPY
jgi:predicted aconitase